MKEKVLPIIVTTKEGLDICFQQNIRLILYITGEQMRKSRGNGLFHNCWRL